VEDLARRAQIRLVPIGGPAAEKIAQVLPYFSRGIIPANTYGEQPAVETLEVGSVLVTNNTMATDLAYGIVRAVWHERNIGLFQAGHPRGKFMDKALAARGLGVPIATGADRYYYENGLMEKFAPFAPLPVSVPKPPAKAEAKLNRNPT
jgi:TRAP transporter TAXI family solute receptor